MKKILIGIAIGISLSAVTIVGAANSIKALLFPVSYKINDQTKTLGNDYVTLNYDSHVYVPIRFVAEVLGAGVAYDEGTKEVIVKQGQLDIMDPDLLVKEDMQVGNLILTKEGDKTRVSGSFKISRRAEIGTNLAFFNDKDEKLGCVVISGQYDGGIHSFEALGDGDFVNYSKAKLHVAYFNGWRDPGNQPNYNQRSRISP
ncbi:stalk domain-containing protein [Paenibacillus tyrfis]|uniref:stalk domain-containing protein n=1 Tax=Paenibacillus tyrfis TaxID=1501230 RepID=UPI000B58B1A1|nr:stalk domain-containing protein [Paenibacillus tyrfis]